MTHRFTQPADNRRPQRWGIGWPAEPLGPERLRLCGILLLLLSIGVWMASDSATPELLEVVDLTPQQVPESLWSSDPSSPSPPHGQEQSYSGRHIVPRTQSAWDRPHRSTAITPANYQQNDPRQYEQQPFETPERAPRLLPSTWTPAGDERDPQSPSEQFPVQQSPTRFAQASPETASPLPFGPVPGDVAPGIPQSQPTSQYPPLRIPPTPTPSYPTDSRPNSFTQTRMQFNFRNAPWEMVLRGFAEKFGLSLQLFNIPQGTFDYYDERTYTETEALDILNGALLGRGALMIRNRNFLVVVAATEAIPTDLIPQVSPDEISSRGRYEFFSVVFPIAHGSPQQMATELQGMASRVGRLIPLSSSNHLYVADLGINLRQIQSMLSLDGGELNQLVSHVVLLKNAPVIDVAKAVNEFLQGGSPSSATTTGDPNGSANFNRSGVSVAAEPSTNGILIRGRPRDVAEVENLIRELDLPREEVLIQALLVEVELDNTHEFGVELGLQDSVLFNRSVVDSLVTLTETITNPGTGTQTTNQRVVSQTSAPGFNFNNAPLGNNTSVNPSRVGTQGLSNFGVGRVNGDLGFGGLVLSAGSESVSLLLRALAANFHVDVLSRPQIRTIDNNEAIIQIGQQVPVVDGVSVNAVGSANPVIRQENAGIILKVIPHVGQGGRISIDAIAEKSQFNTTPGSGVVIFTDATSGNVIEAPIKNLTTAQTTVSVDDGQTIVLGGMISEETVTSERKVPWLGDVPLIGRAFRHDLSRIRRKELLIFLSPQIVHNRARDEALKQIEISRMQFPYQSAMQMHANPGIPGPFDDATRVHGESSFAPIDSAPSNMTTMETTTPEFHGPWESTPQTSEWGPESLRSQGSDPTYQLDVNSYEPQFDGVPGPIPPPAPPGTFPPQYSPGLEPLPPSWNSMNTSQAIPPPGRGATNRPGNSIRQATHNEVVPSPQSRPTPIDPRSSGPQNINPPQMTSPASKPRRSSTPYWSRR